MVLNLDILLLVIFKEIDEFIDARTTTRAMVPVHCNCWPAHNERALLLNTVNPKIGGVLIRVKKGTSKSRQYVL